MVPGDTAFKVLGLTVTWEGIRWAVLFTLRVATAVSYAILFTMTSRWNEIVSANKGVPAEGWIPVPEPGRGRPRGEP